jgi:hypothetical protein
MTGVPTSPQPPDPPEAVQAQERDVVRLLGGTPRQIAHAIKDLLREAWEAGYAFGKKKGAP